MNHGPTFETVFKIDDVEETFEDPFKREYLLDVGALVNEGLDQCDSLYQAEG